MLHQRLEAAGGGFSSNRNECGGRTKPARQQHGHSYHCFGRHLVRHHSRSRASGARAQLSNLDLPHNPTYGSPHSQPLDVVRTRMQGDSCSGGSRCVWGGSTAAAFQVLETTARCNPKALMPNSATTVKCRGMLATARLIIESDGVAGLWRGTGPAVVRMGLGVGVQMVRGGCCWAATLCLQCAFSGSR